MKIDDVTVPLSMTTLCLPLFAFLCQTVVPHVSGQSGRTFNSSHPGHTSRVSLHQKGARSQFPKSLRQMIVDNLIAKIDSRIPPNYEENFPVEVFVQLHITNIDAISETDMEYSIGMFLRQTWVDDRLEHQKLPDIKALELDSKLMSEIWVPDLFMPNEKSASVHMVTVPNKLMHIFPEGRVLYSIRISATLKCNMDLRKFPLDEQTCSVLMESYGYSTENVIFSWNARPIILVDDLKLPQFSMTDWATTRCDKQYIGVNYTCIEFQFRMVRTVGYYITQVYVPSVMIVILSWVSFWLDIDAVPARISLGLLTVLTMTTQSMGVRASLPKVSYIKAIDVWMATCLFFVFSALIEFAYVNVLSRVHKRRLQTFRQTQNGNDKPRAEPPTDAEVQNIYDRGRKRFSLFSPSREKARTLDRVSRTVFPTVFVMFNLVYWCVYVFWTPDPSYGT